MCQDLWYRGSEFDISQQHFRFVYDICREFSALQPLHFFLWSIMTRYHRDYVLMTATVYAHNEQYLQVYNGSCRIRVVYKRAVALCILPKDNEAHTQSETPTRHIVYIPLPWL